MPDPATFRRVGADDLATLLPLLRAYWEYDGIVYREAEVRRGLDALVADPALGSAWLIEPAAPHGRAQGREHAGATGGGPAGYFILTWGFDLEFGGRHAWITDLYVVPEHRGQGLGRQVLAFVDELLRREGAVCVELVVERDNAEALAFYRKLGFAAADRVPLARRLTSAEG